MKSVCVFTNNKNKFNKVLVLNNIHIQYIEHSEIDNCDYNFIDLIVVDDSNIDIKIFTQKLQKMTQIPYIIMNSNKSNDFLKDACYFDVVKTDDNLIELGNYLNNYFKKQSDLAEFDIVDIMQMISIEQKTTLLKIANDDRFGFIAFLKGVPYYANYKTDINYFEGKKAFIELVNKKHNYFKLYPYKENLQQNLEGNLTSLLMDAMCFIDEENTNIEEIPVTNKSDYDFYLESAKNIKGFLGAEIFNNEGNFLSLKVNFQEINQNKDFGNVLLKMHSLLLKVGFGKINYIEIESEKGFLLMMHSTEKSINIILFLEKNTNIPIAKITLQKIISSFKGD